MSCVDKMAVAQDDVTYNFLLVGRTGAGKSSTANSILLSKEARFKTGASSVAVTETVQEEYGKVEGRVVKVVDVPGLADSEKNDEDAIRHVAEQIRLAVERTPDGYDAIIIVITFGRLTKEDMVVVDQLKGIFGEKFISDYGVLLITKCGEFDPNETGVSTIKDWCCNQHGLLENLRRECCDRVVFFENKKAENELKKYQVEQLFHTVDKMKYGPKRYTPDLFKAAKAERDRLLSSATEVYLSEDIKKRIGLIKNGLYAISLNDAAENVPELEEIKREANEFLNEVKKRDRGTGKLGDVVATLDLIILNAEQKLAFAKENIKQSEQQKELKDSISSLRGELKENEQKSRNALAEKEAEIQNMKEQMERTRQEMEQKFQDMMSKQESYLKSWHVMDIVSGITNALSGVAGIASGVAGTVKSGVQTHLLRKGK